MVRMKILSIFLALSLIVSAFAFSAEANQPPAFLMTIARGTPDDVRTAIAAGADVNEVIVAPFGSTTPLMIAAAENANLEIIKILLEAGANVNATGEVLQSVGNTALILAAQFTRNPEVIITLLEAGADVNMEARNHTAGISLKALDVARENPNLRNTEALRLLEEMTEE